MISADRYKACLVALAIGDAYGARYEGGVLERLVWKLIGKTADGLYRYTDDTQMSLDLAASLIDCGGIDQQHIAQRFAQGYHWSRGYGPGAAWLLKQIRNGADWKTASRQRFPAGSWGNGAAMRAPVLGLYFAHDQQALMHNTRLASEVTHAHPLAIEGAQLIAMTTAGALKEQRSEIILEQLLLAVTLDEYQQKLQLCNEYLDLPTVPSLHNLKQQLGNGIAAIDSVVTAIYFALYYRHTSLDELLRHIASLGGDTDTIGAMAGAIWGAGNGMTKLPVKRVNSIESSKQIIRLAEQIYHHVS